MTDSERPPTAYEQFVEAIADLLQSASGWLRQEAGTTVREKVVAPLQRLGLTLVAAITAASLLMLGLALVLTALLIRLGALFGYDLVLGVSGAVLLTGAAAALSVMVKRMQR